MSKCRICLEDELNLCSVYITDRDVSYASMIETLSNIKILEGNYDMICLTCCNKLKDCYDFKLLIERSNLKLNQHLKIIKFNNRDDITFLINVDKKPVNMVHNNIFPNGMTFIHYNNTLIKRMCKKENNEALITENYLNPHLVENDHVDYAELEASAFEVYKRKKNLSHKANCKEPDKRNLCIKPVFMKDLRVLQANSTKFTCIKQKYNRREDICPYCGKKTRFIRKHILQHTAEKSFCCDECNKSFYTKQILISHIKTHLTERNLSFKCDHCIFAFSTKATLIRHMAVHTDAKEFICKICEKAFKWKSGLHRHILIHSFDKKFKCEICNMSFATKYAFQHHYRVHTRERPYKCELCSQPYSYKRDFNRHCLKKHGVFVDYRSINIMNEEILKQEKSLMKDLMLQMHGIKTEREPSDCFKGPRGALAFAKAVKAMQSNNILIDVYL